MTSEFRETTMMWNCYHTTLHNTITAAIYGNDNITAPNLMSTCFRPPIQLAAVEGDAASATIRDWPAASSAGVSPLQRVQKGNYTLLSDIIILNILKLN